MKDQEKPQKNSQKIKDYPIWICLDQSQDYQNKNNNNIDIQENDKNAQHKLIDQERAEQYFNHFGSKQKVNYNKQQFNRSNLQQIEQKKTTFKLETIKTLKKISRQKQTNFFSRISKKKRKLYKSMLSQTNRETPLSNNLSQLKWNKKQNILEDEEIVKIKKNQKISQLLQSKQIMTKTKNHQTKYDLQKNAEQIEFFSIANTLYKPIEQNKNQPLIQQQMNQIKIFNLKELMSKKIDTTLSFNEVNLNKILEKNIEKKIQVICLDKEDQDNIKEKEEIRMSQEHDIELKYMRNQEIEVPEKRFAEEKKSYLQKSKMISESQEQKVVQIRKDDSDNKQKSYSQRQEVIKSQLKRKFTFNTIYLSETNEIMNLNQPFTKLEKQYPFYRFKNSQRLQFSLFTIKVKSILSLKKCQNRQKQDLVCKVFFEQPLLNKQSYLGFSSSNYNQEVASANRHFFYQQDHVSYAVNADSVRLLYPQKLLQFYELAAKIYQKRHDQIDKKEKQLEINQKVQDRVKFLYR